MSAQRHGVKSLEKGIGVLLALAEAQTPLRLADIAERQGMSASMAHAYLSSLVHTGMVEQNPETGRYAVGEGTLLLGMAALRKLDLLPLGRAALLALHQSTAETCFLAIWSSIGPLIVSKIESPADTVFALQVGAPLNLLPSSSGRVFMAYLPTEQWRHLVPDGWRDEDTGRTIGEITVAIRRDGMAALDPVTLPLHSALSAPVFDHEGAIKAVMTAIGPRGRFDSDLEGETARHLGREARALSAKLGFAGTVEGGAATADP